LWVRKPKAKVGDYSILSGCITEIASAVRREQRNSTTLRREVLAKPTSKETAGVLRLSAGSFIGRAVRFLTPHRHSIS
jgi:hypothetical protein